MYFTYVLANYNGGASLNWLNESTPCDSLFLPTSPQFVKKFPHIKLLCEVWNTLRKTGHLVSNQLVLPQSRNVFVFLVRGSSH